jgi:hypothetical protein
MLSAFTTKLNAQHTLIKDSLLVINGAQYGYSINNVQSKDDYERYEIRFFINNTGCTRYITKRVNNSFSGGEENVLAEFNCINASGKRLTTKSKYLRAIIWNSTITEGMSKELVGKTIPVGYIFRSGERISGTEVFLTAKGELPIIQVNPMQIREMN